MASTTLNTATVSVQETFALSLTDRAVDKVEPFGVFVRFAGGRGLVPGSETGTPRSALMKM